MSSAKRNRTCCVCNKLFCCAQCCERHEKKKHSNRQLSCPLCTSQKLPLRLLEDKLLLCHVAIAHLPLYCCLCGEIFKQSKDLESFGTCKWWKSRYRCSLFVDKKPALGIESSITNLDSLTSPPELYRNTSTPMVIGQKSNFDLKTPNVPNFSFKTPMANSASLDIQTRNDFKDNSESNYISFATFATPEETPFRSSSSSSHGNKDSLHKSNSRKLDTMEEQEIIHSTDRRVDNNDVQDMELTGIEGEMLPDSQSLEMCVQTEKRSDSLKKVRFSDEYETVPGPSTRTSNAFNATENTEEYFEVCDTLSEMNESLENSRIKIYEENVKNTEKENCSPQSSADSTRVVMMVVIENNSTFSTSDLIDSGLRKLDRIASEANISTKSHSSPGCSSSITTVDSNYTVSSPDCYSIPNQGNNSAQRNSNLSSNVSESSGSSRLFSMVASVVRTVMKNLSGTRTTRNVEREQVSQREDIVTRSSTPETLNPMLNLVSSQLRRPAKRPRDTLESAPSPQRQMEFHVPQAEFRSPAAKRHHGWYRIKAREPIMRMRNSQFTSPRGVSSETQIFRQGSLSVGDTVLPLPSRAHQSTQTE
ncbi:uncharacterized protein LOC122397941 [Colletes gigas]|uniref:uncharacterized protein LOC122397941 n=1 Tax=Colletes gigas TaxID=935657 RepID=UPI001C9A4217|nr:uncharacterized protein LOC122397941 [Colletes gigas]